MNRRRREARHIIGRDGVVMSTGTEESIRPGAPFSQCCEPPGCPRPTRWARPGHPSDSNQRPVFVHRSVPAIRGRPKRLRIIGLGRLISRQGHRACPSPGAGHWTWYRRPDRSSSRYSARERLPSGNGQSGSYTRRITGSDGSTRSTSTPDRVIAWTRASRKRPMQ